MNDSILKETKDALGINEEDAAFDSELMMHINSALSILYQIGAGQPISVKNKDTKWEKFFEGTVLNQNEYILGQAKLFIFLKTKILFDPPPPSSVEYVNEAAAELLWRIREMCEFEEKKEA